MGNSDSSESEPEPMLRSSTSLSLPSFHSQPSMPLTHTKRNLNCSKDIIVPVKSSRHIDIGWNDQQSKTRESIPNLGNPYIPSISLLDQSVLEGKITDKSGVRFCHKQLPDEHIADLSIESYLAGRPSGGSDGPNFSDAGTKGTCNHWGDESIIDVANVCPFKCDD